MDFCFFLYFCTFDSSHTNFDSTFQNSVFQAGEPDLGGIFLHFLTPLGCGSVHTPTEGEEVFLTDYDPLQALLQAKQNGIKNARAGMQGLASSASSTASRSVFWDTNREKGVIKMAKENPPQIGFSRLVLVPCWCHIYSRLGA